MSHTVAGNAFIWSSTAEWFNAKGFVVADLQLPNNSCQLLRPRCAIRMCYNNVLQGLKTIRVVCIHLDARDWSAKQLTNVMALAEEGRKELFV